jgi:hypothetical protein
MVPSYRLESESSQETNRATATSEVTFNNLPSLKVLIFFLSTTKISIFLFVLYTKFVILMIHADETEIKVK